MHSMRHGAFALLCASIFVAAPLRAGAQEITFTTIPQCVNNYTSNVAYVGRTTKAQFKGPWADYIASANFNQAPGVTIVLSNPISNGSSSTKDASIRVKSDYDWMYEPDGSVYAVVVPSILPRFTKTFGIDIIGPPSLTGASVPRADYYQTVDITLSGENLVGANRVSASAIVDPSHPVVAYGGEAAQVTNGMSIPAAVIGTPARREAVVRLSLPQRLTTVSVDIKLTASNAGACTSFGTGPGTDPPPIVGRRVTMSVPGPPIPPKVQSIDVLNARVGQIADFTITLDKPAPTLPVVRSTVESSTPRVPIGNPMLPYGTLIVWFKMSPSTVFSAVSGDVAYNASGFSQAVVKVGERVAHFKLRVLSLPAGAVNVGTVYIQTWIGDNTKNQPPIFFQKEFTIAQ